jgi:hypothetical protein
MVVISLRDPGAREDITDPFYLRCILELYCRNPQDWDSLLYAIDELVPIPFVDHLGRRLTLAECQRATFWFLTLCQWCRTSGHSSFSIQEGSGNPVAVCNLCFTGGVLGSSITRICALVSTCSCTVHQGTRAHTHSTSSSC